MATEQVKKRRAICAFSRVIYNDFRPPRGENRAAAVFFDMTTEIMK